MDDSAQNTQWHILRVRSGLETHVAASLGVPAYVPHALQSRFNRKFRRVVTFRAPILPGFVFMKLRCPSDFQRPPSSAIYGFMRNGDRSPATLTPSAFRALRQVEKVMNEPKNEDTAETPTALVIGGRVFVTFGSNDAVLAVIVEIQNDHMLTELVGSKLRLRTPIMGPSERVDEGSLTLGAAA